MLAGIHRPQTAVTQSGGSGLKLGTVTYEIARDWDVPTIIKNLTDVGMEAVELRTTHKHGVEISLAPAARAEVRKRFADSPVKIGGLGTTCEYHAPDHAVLRRNIDETKDWVKLASDVGSPSVKVRPNGLPRDVPEERTLEQIGKTSGFQDAYFLVSCDGGKAIALTLWESRAAMDASAVPASRLRSEAARAVGGDVLAVEEYEVPIHAQGAE